MCSLRRLDWPGRHSGKLRVLRLPCLGASWLRDWHSRPLTWSQSLALTYKFIKFRCLCASFIQRLFPTYPLLPSTRLPVNPSVRLALHIICPVRAGCVLDERLFYGATPHRVINTNYPHHSHHENTRPSSADIAVIIINSNLASHWLSLLRPFHPPSPIWPLQRTRVCTPSLQRATSCLLNRHTEALHTDC